MNAESKQILKLAIGGAITAVLLDHFIKPSVNSALKF